jgi:hypothetical protein
MIFRGTLEINEGRAGVGGLQLVTGTFDELGLNRAVDVLYSKGFVAAKRFS